MGGEWGEERQWKNQIRLLQLFSPLCPNSLTMTLLIFIKYLIKYRKSKISILCFAYNTADKINSEREIVYYPSKVVYCCVICLKMHIPRYTVQLLRSYVSLSFRQKLSIQRHKFSWCPHVRDSKPRCQPSTSFVVRDRSFLMLSKQFHNVTGKKGDPRPSLVIRSIQVSSK